MGTLIIDIFRVSCNLLKGCIKIEVNVMLVLILLPIGLLIVLLTKKHLSKNYKIFDLSVELSGSPKIDFMVKRNEENLYIANRIYLELVTRKAALPFDENHDAINEVYDSWYKLFNIIREEIKNVPGSYLKSHNATEALIGLTLKILNESLRPHLTKYQARYNKWYKNESINPANEKLTPQEIQKRYPDYNELVISLKEVNLILKDYSDELLKLIKG